MTTDILFPLNLQRDVHRRYPNKEILMSVKIFITRKVTDDNIIKLTVLLKQLRSLTVNQPGYVSGETLRRTDKNDECLVISTWRSLEDWDNWLNNENRTTIQREIDKLLGQETTYAVYEN